MSSTPQSVAQIRWERISIRLPEKDHARVLRSLDMLEQLGTQLSMPYARKLTGTSLWELRIRGGTQHRVLYIAIQGRRLLLLHAFGKKVQMTPKREIATAEHRLIDYQKRMQR